MAQLKISSDLENVIKKVVLDTYFPVGSLYLTVGNEDPNQTIGGTWERIKGRCIVGVDENDTDFNTVSKTGGEKTHTLTVDEMPAHNHNILGAMNGASGSSWCVSLNSDRSINWAITNGSENKGGGQAHNNLQPYYTAYIWQRTA